MSATPEVLCDGFYYSLTDEKVLEALCKRSGRLALLLSSAQSQTSLKSSFYTSLSHSNGLKRTSQLSSEAGEKRAEPLDS